MILIFYDAFITQLKCFSSRGSDHSSCGVTSTGLTMAPRKIRVITLCRPMIGCLKHWQLLIIVRKANFFQKRRPKIIEKSHKEDLIGSTVFYRLFKTKFEKFIIRNRDLALENIPVILHKHFFTSQCICKLEVTDWQTLLR